MKTIHSLGIFLLIFLLSCSSDESKLSEGLTREEKADLEYFFRMLLFDAPRGAFVLFGSKPLSEIAYFDTTGEENSPFSRNPARGWKAFQKVRTKHPLRKYIFTLWKNESIILADIQKTAFILAENYEAFKKSTGMDFHPLEVVFELENSDSPFWNQVFSYNDPLTVGLLFGFGNKNSLLWAWKSDFEDKPGKVADYFHDHPPGTSIPRTTLPKGVLARHAIKIASRPEEIEIPFFERSDEDEMAEKYLEEKKKIVQIYRGKDLVEVTLKKLSG